MVFVAHFVDKLRFFDQVLREDGERRFFVATEEPLHTGTSVTVDLHVGDEPITTVQATVVAVVAKGGGAEPGAWMQLEDVLGSKLRQGLQVTAGDAANASARTFPRFMRSLQVYIDKPITSTVRTIDISQGGISIDALLPIPVGQTIRMVLTFGEERVGLYGRVAWRKEQAKSTGVQFRFQKEATRKQVVEQVRRIAAAEKAQVQTKATILVVDDDPATLMALERALDVEGYHTLTATTGPEALSMTRENRPSVVLLDMLLPGMNGLEVCRILKRDVGTSAVPVIVTSVLPHKDLERLLSDTGALVALPKPYRIQVLSDLVRTVLHRGQNIRGTDDGAGSEKRESERTAIFERCYFESEDLHLEGQLRDASEGGAFLLSYWGEPVGTRGKITLLNDNEEPVTLEVEVVDRQDWGLITASTPERVSGLRLRFIDTPARDDFARWIRDRQEEEKERTSIVVVDDDQAQLEILSTVLKKAGFSVLALDSPMAVVNAVSMVQPGLVIVDYMMPGLDGRTLCQTLKMDPRTEEVPVWLYSSVGDDHLAQLIAEAGADGGLQKNARLSTLVDKVRDFLDPD